MVSGGPEISMFGGYRIGSNDLVSLIHEAARDETCKGFIVRIGQLNSSLGTLAAVQEIKAELKRAKMKGKKIIVFIEQWATLPEYYLATVADSIVMPELGTISHLGLKIELTKTIRFLEKFGFEEEVISTGEYKDAFTSSQKLTKNDKKLIKEVLSTLYQQVLSDLQKERNISWDTINTYFDGRLISASEAKKIGLVDHIGYWESVKDVVKTSLNSDDLEYSKSASIQNIMNFVDTQKKQTWFSSFNRIAVIEVDGSIQSGANRTDALFGGKSTGADYFEKIVDIILDSYFLRGVIVRVNSPGGSLIASDRIYQAIERLKKKKIPVYVSMGVMATSGGYYVSMNADKIYANSNTITGSIGVISTYKNKVKFNDMFGFDVEEFKIGKYMSVFSPNHQLTDDEKKMLKAYQSEKYQFFVNKLKKNRGLSDAEVSSIAQGQLFTGSEAKDLKLIDEIGGLYDAVDDMSRAVKISGQPEIIYYRPKPQRTLNLFDGSLFRKLLGF